MVSNVKCTFLMFIEPGNIIPLYQTDDEYVKSFNEKYAKLEDKPIKSMDDAELSYYIFSVGKLGWINCDRFIEYEEKVDLIVDVNESPDLKLKLAFRNINGVLKPKIKNDKYVFYGVPVGEEATLIGIKTSDEKIEASIEPLTISDNPIKNLKYSDMTLSELREKLNQI